MPAPVSSSTWSKCGRTCSIMITLQLVAHFGRQRASTRPCRSRPAAPRSRRAPAGWPVQRRLPVNTSCSVIFGNRFSTTSRLARPRSASSTSTAGPGAPARRPGWRRRRSWVHAALAAGDSGDARARDGRQRWGRSVIRGPGRWCRTAPPLLVADLVTPAAPSTRFAALGLGAVELLVGAFDPQRGRRPHPLRRKAPPTLMVTPIWRWLPRADHRPRSTRGAPARPPGAKGAGAVGRDDGEFLAADAPPPGPSMHAVPAREPRRGSPRRRRRGRGSFTRLKWSMSTTSSRAGFAAAPRGRPSRASASSKQRRLARPVSVAAGQVHQGVRSGPAATGHCPVRPAGTARPGSELKSPPGGSSPLGGWGILHGRFRWGVLFSGSEAGDESVYPAFQTPDLEQRPSRAHSPLSGGRRQTGSTSPSSPGGRRPP